MAKKYSTGFIFESDKKHDFNLLQTEKEKKEFIYEKKQINYFEKIPIDYSWSFSNKTIKDTSYITHGYYTYPAKFIPQLVSRLIKEYSNENDIVVDPFMGSGTTVLESIVHNRIGIGSDINNIAYLITKVKTTPIKDKDLLDEFTNLTFGLAEQTNAHYNDLSSRYQKFINSNDRIDYWFLPEQKEKLITIFDRILAIQDTDIQEFFLVSFSQILKSCSIWLQKSIKPTRDLSKKIYEPATMFYNQSKKMIQKNFELEQILSSEVKKNIRNYRIIKCGDSRKLLCKDNHAQLVVTSPPYVTSYEYADLHQLPSLWLGYLKDLSIFRKKFIGSSHTNRRTIDLKSSLADDIILKLGKSKKAEEVRNYFADMLESFIEMRRVLKRKGKVCIVIGNTEFKGVKIYNAEVFKEQLENIGFSTCDIIRREIPSKMLPSTRDKKTGRFVKSDDKNLKKAYPTEYIIVMEKIA